MNPKITILLFLIFNINCFSQENTAFENALAKKFPQQKSSSTDDIWTYDPQNKSTKLELPILNNAIPDYTIYSALLTNSRNHQVGDSECAFLFNEKTGELVFGIPSWHSGFDKDFYKKLIGLKLNNLSDLDGFAVEFQQLAGIGEDETVLETEIKPDSITFSTFVVPEDGTYRTIRILFDSLTLKEIQNLNNGTLTIIDSIK